ncbi:hypothetical protein [Actinomadura roseirufa]|uniref:hypothetical protein n=1 Tax=Actinomadura roseirufa TaxID=2094049 RepID=UPI00104182E2|nr:hypothetical protein [Actinomadura roseirufa]
MFGQRQPCVQIVKGRTRDAERLREAAERWYRDVAPGAKGWLGTTGGVTDDGLHIGVTRFASPRAAHRNDRRRAQARWWAETRDLFEGDVTVEMYTDVETFGRGGSDDAGFVQILQTRVRDREAVRPFIPDGAQRILNRRRPDMIGGLFCIRPDGFCLGVAYFTSREAARKGEQTRMPPEYQSWRDEQMRYFDEDAVFYDLNLLWLQSP